MRLDATGDELDPGPPVPLFEGRYELAPYGGRQANYDVSPDGRRFLMVRRKNLPQPTTVEVVLNWPEALLGEGSSTPGGDFTQEGAGIVVQQLVQAY